MLRWIAFALVLSLTVMVLSKPFSWNFLMDKTTTTLEPVKRTENKTNNELLTSMRPDFSSETGSNCADKCTDFYMAMIKNHPEFEIERLRDESLACIRRCRVNS